ncbi:hypothetical protein HYZ97_03025 [Candidatus Pacearchaeota archaeon]|nr:hypothetical protein [Candidatus Pacearchaeota archaeon]
MSENTTIKLSKKTKARLDNLKEYRLETYEEVLEKMLSLLNLCRNQPDEARKRLIDLEQKKRFTE